MKWGKHPGRVRLRLAALLLQKGIEVSPYDLWVQEGAYRSHYWDLACWGTDKAKFVNGIAPDGTPFPYEVQLSSWSTMTDCVRRGIDAGKEDEFGTWHHVAVECAGMEKRSRKLVDILTKSDATS
jgi:hypothetical protein